MTFNSQELARIAHVFGVDDFADTPWSIKGPRGPYDSSAMEVPLWNEGVPDYVESEFRDYEGDFRTIYYDALFGDLAPEIVDFEDARWVRVRGYTHSGERDCPWSNSGRIEEEECPLCEEVQGEEHGCVYIGDGWMELVYRRVPRWHVHIPGDPSVGLPMVDELVFTLADLIALVAPGGDDSICTGEDALAAVADQGGTCRQPEECLRHPGSYVMRRGCSRCP